MPELPFPLGGPVNAVRPAGEQSQAAGMQLPPFASASWREVAWVGFADDDDWAPAELPPEAAEAPSVPDTDPEADRLALSRSASTCRDRALLLPSRPAPRSGRKPDEARRRSPPLRRR